MKSIISASIIMGKVSLFCGLTSILVVLQYHFFEEAEIIMMNPLISGFIHLDMEHFSYNIILMFLFLLADVNRNYDFKKLFLITFVLSLLYLPFAIFGLTGSAVGISGTLSLLAVRYFLSWKSYPKTGIGIAIFICASEVYALTQPFDGVAHIMHLMGMGLGILSLRRKVAQDYELSFA